MQGVIRLDKIEMYRNHLIKIAAEIGGNFSYHASPVQDIKKFRFSKDTSGNNKGNIIFASKHPEFAAVFGTRWHDGNARLNVETKNKKVPDEDNYIASVLNYTDKVDLDKPCSMYKLKGSFKPLRYGKDLEQYTDKDVEIISEEKFDSFKDMAKVYGVKLNKVKESYVRNRLKEHKTSNFEKKAAEENLKIPQLEEAFKGDPIAKKVAYMIATSHEYKTPNIHAALVFTKNYKWELSGSKVSNLQGIDKPVDQEKVGNMASSMKKIKPFVAVNKFQGITPQSKGKLILIDGHHRKAACEVMGKEYVPIYKGTYTGNAELSDRELIEKKAMYKEEIIKLAASMGKQHQSRLDKIKKAGATKTMLNITYTDKKGATSTRLVEPYKVDGDDFWGYDPSKEGIRRFKSNKIRGVKNTGKQYVPRWEIEV